MIKLFSSKVGRMMNDKTAKLKAILL